MRGTQFYFSPELWNIFNTRANFGRYNPLAADILYLRNYLYRTAFRIIVYIKN